MRLILLLTIILLSSCENENKKETIVNRQQAIQKKMEEVKALYYKKADSLENAMKADTNSTKLNQTLSVAEEEKTAMLIPLQKEFDSLEAMK